MHLDPELTRINRTSGYSKEAEELLSKAVKLDPANIDAWNALGQCFWKKGDLTGARNCFDGALGQKVNAVSSHFTLDCTASPGETFLHHILA